MCAAPGTLGFRAERTVLGPTASQSSQVLGPHGPPSSQLDVGRLRAMLVEMREVYGRPTLQDAIRSMQPQGGMALATRGQGLNFLMALKELVSPLQDPVFARHGYPPNPAGVERMKADADAAVLAGDASIARLSNDLHKLLGLVPIGRSGSHSSLHPQIVAHLEQRALNLGDVCVEQLLLGDRDVLLADLRKHGVLSADEELAVGADIDQLLREKLRAVNFKKAKNQLVREFLTKHPARLGVEPSAWRHAWADETVSATCAASLMRDGFVVLDGVLDVAEGAAEIARLHHAGELAVSADVCNRGAKAVFLNFSTAEERAYHRAALPGLASLAERLAGLPHAFMLASLAARLTGNPHAFTSGEPAGLLAGLRLDLAVMLSAYEPGVAYRRHLDSYGGDDNHRMLTVLLYLNKPDYGEEAGGALRLYRELAPEGKGRAKQDSGPSRADCVDVLPTAGRIVAFLSRRVWHEVQPAARDRYAMTLWVPAPVPET